MLVNGWHTKCHLKVSSDDFWNFAISKFYLLLEQSWVLSHLRKKTWNKMEDPAVQTPDYL